MELKRYLCRSSRCPVAKLNPQKAVIWVGTVNNSLWIKNPMPKDSFRCCAQGHQAIYLWSSTKALENVNNVVIVRSGESLTERSFSFVLPLPVPRKPNREVHVKSFLFPFTEPVDFY